jgi:hypothetical protein
MFFFVRFLAGLVNAIDNFESYLSLSNGMIVSWRGLEAFLNSVAVLTAEKSRCVSRLVD